MRRPPLHRIWRARASFPLLENPQGTVKAGAFTQHPRPAYFKGAPEVMGVSVRTQNLRYTEWRNFATGLVEARELYDHASDPGETRNVIGTHLRNAAALAQAQRLLEGTFPRQGWEIGPNSPAEQKSAKPPR